MYIYLNTSSNGLSDEEYQTRLSIDGNNTIECKKTFHPLKNFAKQLVNLMAIMHWVASILSLVSGTPLLSYVIWFIIVVNAIFSFVQEKKADEALQTLAKMIPNNVKVYRNGKIHVLTADQLVPGDVVTLKPGDKVPADIRITSSEGLLVDNSMLTGESVAVDRNEKSDSIEESSITNSHNLLFAGTSITAGNATGVVFATGEDS